MLHRTTRVPARGIHAGRREFAEKRRRGVTPLITTCNGRAVRTRPQGGMATRRCARLCDPGSTVLRLWGDFDGNRGQSTESILQKSSICH